MAGARPVRGAPVRRCRRLAGGAAVGRVQPPARSPGCGRADRYRRGSCRRADFRQPGALACAPGGRQRAARAPAARRGLDARRGQRPRRRRRAARPARREGAPAGAEVRRLGRRGQAGGHEAAARGGGLVPPRLRAAARGARRARDCALVRRHTGLGRARCAALGARGRALDDGAGRRRGHVRGRTRQGPGLGLLARARGGRPRRHRGCGRRGTRRRARGAAGHGLALHLLRQACARGSGRACQPAAAATGAQRGRARGRRRPPGPAPRPADDRARAALRGRARVELQPHRHE